MTPRVARDNFFQNSLIIINICNVIITQAVLYTYHQYIVGFTLTRAFAYETVYFFIRDYCLEQNKDNLQQN